MKKINKIFIIITTIIFFNMSFLNVYKAEHEISINTLTFPDDIFRSIVEAEFGPTLSVNEINGKKTFVIDNKDIRDLSGLQYFVQLEELNVNDNKLKTINLNANSELKVLSAASNRITEIDITQNLNLQFVNLSNNRLTKIDLSNNTLLKSLDLGNNKITDVVGIEYTSLSNLYINNNNLTYLNLEALDNLEALLLDGNSIDVTITEDYIDMSNYMDQIYFKNIREVSQGEYENGIITFDGSEMPSELIYVYNTKKGDLAVKINILNESNVNVEDPKDDIDTENYEGLLLEFDLNGASGKLSPIKVVKDQAIGKLPVPVREGYKFYGWKIGEENLNASSAYRYDDDQVAVAVWGADKVDVVYVDYNDVVLEKFEEEVGMAIPPSTIIPVRVHYEFVDWELLGAKVVPEGGIVIKALYSIKDSDEDGVSDLLELEYGTDLYQENTKEEFATIDSDSDGLPNEKEELYNTDPFNIDTDHDGISDYDEIKEATNPLKKNNTFSFMTIFFFIVSLITSYLCNRNIANNIMKGIFIVTNLLMLSYILSYFIIYDITKLTIIDNGTVISIIHLAIIILSFKIALKTTNRY